MDDRQGARRQDDEQRTEGGKTASKGINPVQHSERGINPAQHSEGRQADEPPGRGDEGNEKGNG
ncbi:MAG TPA: hypothetical protein VK421_01645 [Pyrinomonadaceae bacterium]|nr:hypothetical protein [Pyrinomonadaceae bacterium]